jgi:hypothetical protein
VSELRNTSAGEDERQRMLEILQRLHQQEVEEGGSGGGCDDDAEEGGGSGEEDDEGGGGLSSQTLHRLLAKVRKVVHVCCRPQGQLQGPAPAGVGCALAVFNNACCSAGSAWLAARLAGGMQMQATGGTLDVSADDLTPAELAAFHRALAAGELSGAVQAWEPWWLSEEAARLELSAAGTPLVVVAGAGEAEGQQQEQPQQQPRGAVDADGDGSSKEPASIGAAGGTAAAAAGSPLPPPPSRPLPPLSALTRAAPSPLLRWQLLDLLYSYCFTLRRYNGDYQLEAADAADTLFALSSVLAAVAPSSAGGSSTGEATSSSSSSAGDAGAAPALLGCVQRAFQPPVGGRDDRGFAVGVVSDVAAVLQLGRPAVVTALMDMSRLVEAARRELEGASSSGGDDAAGSSGSSSSSRTKQVGLVPGGGWVHFCCMLWHCL